MDVQELRDRLRQCQGFGTLRIVGEWNGRWIAFGADNASPHAEGIRLSQEEQGLIRRVDEMLSCLDEMEQIHGADPSWPVWFVIDQSRALVQDVLIGPSGLEAVILLDLSEVNIENLAAEPDFDDDEDDDRDREALQVCRARHSDLAKRLGSVAMRHQRLVECLRQVAQAEPETTVVDLLARADVAKILAEAHQPEAAHA